MIGFVNGCRLKAKSPADKENVTEHAAPAAHDKQVDH